MDGPIHPEIGYILIFARIISAFPEEIVQPQVTYPPSSEIRTDDPLTLPESGMVKSPTLAPDPSVFRSQE